MPVGTALRVARTSVGETQLSLGRKVTTSEERAQATVSEWESGSRPIGFEKLAEVEDALGLRRGHVLRLAGLVTDLPLEETIASDPTLTPAQREALLASYRELKRRHR